jgi:hypothetical protein
MVLDDPTIVVDPGVHFVDRGVRTPCADQHARARTRVLTRLCIASRAKQPSPRASRSVVGCCSRRVRRRSWTTAARGHGQSRRPQRATRLAYRRRP